MQLMQIAFLSVVLQVMQLKFSFDIDISTILELPIEVVHRERGAGTDLEEALSSLHGLLYGIVVVVDVIVTKGWLYISCQTQA